MANRTRGPEAKGRWKGGRRLDKSGYILIWHPEHPDSDQHGYVREHRVVAERVTGRPLRVHEAVHHLNGDKADNRPENLKVLTHRQHALLHAFGVNNPNWRGGKVTISCAWCQKPMQVFPSRAREGKTCSYICMGKRNYQLRGGLQPWQDGRTR